MKKAPPKFTIANIFLKAAGRYKLQAFFLVLILTVKQALDLGAPILYKNFVNTLSSGTGDKRSTLIGILILLGFIYYGRIILRTIGEFINNRFQPQAMADITELGYRHLIRHSYQFFSNNFSGGLLRKVQRLAFAFEAIVDTILYNIIPIIVVSLGSIAVIWTSSRTIAIVMFFWNAVIALVNYAFNRKIMESREKRAAVDSEVTGALADSISNSLNVKLFPAFEHEEKIIDKILTKLKKLRTRNWDMHTWMIFIEVVCLASFEISVMYIAIGAWQKGTFTIGDFVLLQMLMAAMWQTLWGLGNIFRTLGEATADAQEMVDIMNTPYDIVDVPNAKPLAVSDGKIVFDKATFNYNETRTVFKNLSLEIKPREKIALVGPSGAGKSTVTKLLFRFYELTSGNITIDGQDISKVTQDSLREAVSMVPQDPLLFHRSLMDNIRYGRRGASDKEVIAAAKKAHCHEFITALPEGYKTLVGERGIKLSGGERQRVAIARAILKDSPILVLDEATSSLDSESEHLIHEALHELMKNKTVIVIAHRLSTIMEMDRIVVLENGKVTDMGTHEELLKRTGTYKKLWEIQAGGFLP